MDSEDLKKVLHMLLKLLVKKLLRLLSKLMDLHLKMYLLKVLDLAETLLLELSALQKLELKVLLTLPDYLTVV